MGKRIKIIFILVITIFLTSCESIQSDSSLISQKDKDIYCWVLSQNQESCLEYENTDFFLRLTIVGGLGLPAYIFTLKEQDQNIISKEKKQIKIDSFLKRSLAYNKNIFLKKKKQCNKYLIKKGFFKRKVTLDNNDSIIIDDGLQWFLEVKNKNQYKFISRSFSSQKDKDIILEIAQIYDVKYKKIAIEKLFAQ